MDCLEVDEIDELESEVVLIEAVEMVDAEYDFLRPFVLFSGDSLFVVCWGGSLCGDCGFDVETFLFVQMLTSLLVFVFAILKRSRPFIDGSNGATATLMLLRITEAFSGL